MTTVRTLPTPERRAAVEGRVDALCQRHNLSPEQTDQIRRDAVRALRAHSPARAIALAARSARTARRPERDGTGIDPEAA